MPRQRLIPPLCNWAAGVFITVALVCGAHPALGQTANGSQTQTVEERPNRRVDTPSTWWAFAAWPSRI